MSFGENIIKHRKKAKLSQDEIAEKLGVTRQTISNWELNITLPDVGQLFELSNYLYTDYTNLIEDCFVVNKELQKIKEHIMIDLSNEFDDRIFNCYFSKIRFYNIEGDTLHIGCGGAQKSGIKSDYENILINNFNKYSDKKIKNISYHIDDKLLF